MIRIALNDRVAVLAILFSQNEFPPTYLVQRQPQSFRCSLSTARYNVAPELDSVAARKQVRKRGLRSARSKTERVSDNTYFYVGTLPSIP